MFDEMVVYTALGSDRKSEAPRLGKARSRRVIYDKRPIPDDCQLWRDDWTITLTTGN